MVGSMMIQVWAEHGAVLFVMSVGAAAWTGDGLDSYPFHALSIKLSLTSSRDTACLNILIMSFDPTKGSVGL